MSEENPYLGQLRSQAGLRLMVLFASFFVLILVSAMVAQGLAAIPGIGERTALLLSSLTQCVVAFCLPAWLTAKFASKRPWQFLGVSKVAPWRAFEGVMIVYLLALPAMNWLIEWNANIHLPEWASGFEATLRSWEESNAGVANKVLMSDSFWGMLAGVAIIGIATGFSEEVFFRGALQTIFKETGMKAWLAVWATAIIFSAIHFQFFGFIPRVLMGAFFGYLLVWTGSLWPGVFAHAFNNSIVVIGAWVWGDPEATGMTEMMNPWLAISSALATVIFFRYFRNYFFKTNSSVNG